MLSYVDASGRRARGHLRRDRRVRRVPRDLPAAGARTCRCTSDPIRTPGWASSPTRRPSTDELIYSRHADGFALYSMRSPEVSRLYLQVPADESLESWPDDRIWAELQKRFALAAAGRSPRAGSPTSRSRRCAASSPGRCATGGCSWPGDAAHIVPPTGAKGLNLAVGDAMVLANALSRAAARGIVRAGRRLLRHLPAPGLAGHPLLLLHDVDDARPPGGGPVRRRRSSSPSSATSRPRRAAATSLAENYSGYEPVRFEL